MTSSTVPKRIPRVTGDIFYGLALAIVAGLGNVAAGATEPATTSNETVFAKVGDTVISWQEFDQTLARAKRQRFYHFQPPPEQAEAFRREVADDLINRVLLVQEATRRGLEPDDHEIRQKLDGYEKRYAESPRWAQEGARLLDSLKTYLEQEDRLRQLEEQVRQVASPSEQQVREFYEANPDKFTEPAQQRVSVILLKVDPSSSSEVWQAAETEGTQIVSRLREGADFAELASLHSGDQSAKNGGDMGYVHKGMLAAEAETALDKLKIGEVSEPLRMLEGVAIFGVVDRRPGRLQEFSAVRDRAQELWLREQGENAWKALQQGLRASTQIEVLDASLASSD